MDFAINRRYVLYVKIKPICYWTPKFQNYFQMPVVFIAYEWKISLLISAIINIIFQPSLGWISNISLSDIIAKLEDSRLFWIMKHVFSLLINSISQVHALVGQTLYKTEQRKNSNGSTCF